MEKEQLERYRSQKEEIQELQYKLEHLGEGDSLIGNDIIFNYSTGYPRAQTIVGYDYKKHCRLRTRYEDRIQKMQADCDETEQWIEAIPDSLTRRIFRMCYIEGMTQAQIGKRVHMDRSYVSKKIDAFLNVSHNSHNSHL